MPSRTWMVACFVCLLLLGLIATGGAQPGTLKEIVPGVWFREGDIRQYGHCNNVIIEMRDYLVVVDANFPSGARAVLEDARKVSSKPVKYVFDTHHHGDHLYGNPVFTRMGAVTIAHQGVLDEMKRYEPKSWQAAAKGRKDIAELNLEAPEPPKITFGKSPYVIQDGTRRIELHFFGWAHTRGDAFAYLPKEKVLCTGDAIVNGAYNFTGHGNVGNWPNVIRAAQKLDVVHVLPGHGAPGGKQIMAGQLEFFLELDKAVRAAIRQGRKLEELVTLKDGRPVATTLQLPDKVGNWVGGPLPSQVRDRFQEITTGKPAGDQQGR